MKDYEIVLSKSEYEKLIAETRQLKQDIAALTAEKDDLELHICREILADYNEKVGNLEYEALQKMLEIKQLKRTIEYIQAAINRQEQTKVTYEEAKQKTKEDYKQYEDDLKKKAEDIKKNAEYARERAKQDEKNRQEAKRRAEEKSFSAHKDIITKEASESEKTVNEDGKKSGTKSADTEKQKAGEGAEERTEENKATEEEPKKTETPEEELKRLYRKIVKKLHPDMNPDATEAEKRLLQEAMDAYEKGDLERLREIAEEIDDEDIAEKYKDTPEDLEKLRELRDRLLLQKKDLEYQIQAIKDDFPYNVKDFLADEDAVQKRQEQVRQFMQACDEEIERLNKRIEELREKLNQ